tara:strand:- start:213 stop:467 length:255 start_codon:yes stop_codon:yes gene_type:complete
LRKVERSGIFTLTAASSLEFLSVERVRFTSPAPLLHHSKQFIAAIEVWVFSISERIKIESSVHPSIIYAQKGITTGFSSFCLVK